LDAQQRVLLCVNAILEKKAGNLVVLKVKDVSSFTDYFILCDGSSDRQVQAIAAVVQERMKSAGILPMGVEGEQTGKWVLLDYADVIIHVFYQPLREFYNLERLWSDVPTMTVPDDTVAVTQLCDGM
jgi:ribosome-associated protein